MTTTPTVDQLCNVYVKIREKKREIVKKYEEELALYDGKLDALAGAMKDMLVAAGATSMKTDHGTVYSCQDPLLPDGLVGVQDLDRAE
ncbi:MAG: hypothetical protein IPH85_13780 [Ignavibacteria bacterium]|nr:hypothetical protein [Ignavibacteria bacterium]